MIQLITEFYNILFLCLKNISFKVILEYINNIDFKKLQNSKK